MNVKEIMEQLNIAAKRLVGKKVGKVAGEFYSDLCEKEINKLGIIEYPLQINGSLIYVDVKTFGKIDVFMLKPIYREYEWKTDEMSDYIDHVEVINVDSLPEDFLIENIPQKLRYDLAEERKKDLERQIKELEEEMNSCKEEITEMEHIMEVERYEE